MNNTYMILGVLKFLRDELRHTASIEESLDNTIEGLEEGLKLFREGKVCPLTFKELAEGTLKGKTK